MKNGRLLFRATLVFLVLGRAGVVRSQWGTTGTETYLNPAQNGVNIGTSTTPASVLTVRGDEAATPTGEVFRTDAPAGGGTNWRMFCGGAPIGRLFSLLGQTNFNLDANQGELRFSTNNLLRMRLMPTLPAQTVNGYTTVDLSGHLGIGLFSNPTINRKPPAKYIL